MISRIFLPILLLTGSFSMELCSSMPASSPRCPHTHYSALVHPHQNSSPAKAKATFFNSPTAIMAGSLVTAGCIGVAIGIYNIFFNKSHQHIFHEASDLYEECKYTHKDFLHLNTSPFNEDKQIALKTIINASTYTYKYVASVLSLQASIHSLQSSQSTLIERMNYIKSHKNTTKEDVDAYHWLNKMEVLYMQQGLLLKNLIRIKQDIELLPEYDKQKKQKKEDEYRTRVEQMKKEKMQLLRENNRIQRELAWQNTMPKVVIHTHYS